MKKLYPFILTIILFSSIFFSLFYKLENIELTNMIILNLRLPRTLLCIITGAVLALCGSTLQMFFRNPLAEPGIMGISSGATLGAVVAAISGFSGTMLLSVLNVGAFLGAILAGLLITSLSLKKVAVSSINMLLCGTALGTFYSGISSTIMLMHNKELHGIYSWLLGSFNGRGLNELKFVALPALAAFVLMALILNPLDMLNGGEENASSLGVNVKKLRLLVIASGSLAVSVAVCGGGTISFVGLIAPHIMRRIFSPKSRILVWTSALGGAVILLLADTLARVVMRPGELPCGIITSFIGVPFFVALILKKRGGGNE